MKTILRLALACLTAAILFGCASTNTDKSIGMVKTGNTKLSEYFGGAPKDKLHATTQRTSRERMENHLRRQSNSGKLYQRLPAGISENRSLRQQIADRHKGLLMEKRTLCAAQLHKIFEKKHCKKSLTARDAVHKFK